MRRRKVLVMVVVATVAAMAHVQAAGAATKPEHGYVTSSLQLPTTNTQAAQFGRNLDGQRGRDNALGQVFAALAAQGVDLAGSMAEAVTTGDVVMLHSLRTFSLANTKSATWQVLYGEPTADPDFSGAGSFDVGAFTPRSARLPATIRDHHVRTGAGTIPVTLDFGGGSLVLQMAKGRVFATCTRAACSGGRVNGAVSSSQVDNRLLPALAQLFTALVQRDCPGPGPESCAADSTGKQLEALFDADSDLVITADELRESPLIESLLAPDLDLKEADGSPGHDGVPDSLSFGFGFAAVRAKLVRG